MASEEVISALVDCGLQKTNGRLWLQTGRLSFEPIDDCFGETFYILFRPFADVANVEKQSLRTVNVSDLGRRPVLLKEGLSTGSSVIDHLHLPTQQQKNARLKLKELPDLTGYFSSFCSLIALYPPIGNLPT